MMTVKESVSAVDVADAINCPLELWEGACHAIALAIHEYGLPEFEGFRPAYGSYRGYVAPGTMFHSAMQRLGWVRHGWLVNDETGMIADPTAFVFTDPKPYDESQRIPFILDTSDYDEGANILRAMFRRPFPAADAHGDHWDDLIGLTLEGAAHDIAVALTGRDPEDFTRAQVAWIANTPYDELQGQAPSIYAAVEAAGQGAFIPYDNRVRANPEEHFG